MIIIKCIIHLFAIFLIFYVPCTMTSSSRYITLLWLISSSGRQKRTKLSCRMKTQFFPPTLQRDTLFSCCCCCTVSTHWVQQVRSRGIRLDLPFQNHGIEFHYLILDAFQLSFLYVAPGGNKTRKYRKNTQSCEKTAVKLQVKGLACNIWCVL